MPITQLHPGAITGRRYGSFAGKTPAATRFAAWFTGGPPKKRQNPKKQRPRRAVAYCVLEILSVRVVESFHVLRQPVKRWEESAKLNLSGIGLKASQHGRQAPAWVAEKLNEARKNLAALQDESEVAEVLSILRAIGILGA